MRACPRCGREHADDVHFCSCGAFLDWDPPAERDVTAAAPTSELSAAAVTVAAPPAPAAGVSLWLLRPDGPVDDAHVDLEVPAGGRATLIARLRNQSDIVDSYQLALDGLPDGWWTIDPPTAYLLPLGSREGYEEDVAIALHPPRSPDAEARAWPFTVTVTSRSHPTRVAHASASLDIQPFWQIAAVAQPAMVTGRRRRTLSCVVTNLGNAAVAATIAATDAEDRCRFAVPAAPVRVGPGQSHALPVVVRARRPRVIGRPLDHRIELTALGAGGEEGLGAQFAATYRQRAWIPWWLPLVVLLLLVAGLVVYLLWPDRADVPDLRKAPSAFVAQKRLEKHGLTLDPRVRRVSRARGRAGSVVDQVPAPGTEVDHGTAVSIVVAAGRGRVEVPKVTGVRLDAADQQLQEAGLTLGAVEPKLDPKAVVRGQIPRAGVMRRRGSPVNVVLAKPKSGGKKKKAAAAPLPAVTAGSAAAAKAALEKAGLTPLTRLRIDPAERGTVLGTVPAEGEPPPADGRVALIVSAGFPLLAYQSGTDALVVGGLKGLPVVGTVGNGSVTSLGSWTPDGRRLAYVSKGKLFIATPGSGRRGQRIRLRKGRRAAHAAVAPLPGRTVLAVVARGGPAGVDEVCRIELTPRRRSRGCRSVPGWRLGEPAWRPTGKQLLVAAAAGRRFGLLRLTGRSAFSKGRRSGRDKLATRTAPGEGVRAAAFSPDGSSLAVVTNLGADSFRLALVAPDDLKLARPDYLPIQGCDVAWRPDGEELAIVQAGPAYTDASGSIARARPDSPRTVRIVVVGGQRPSWQPIDLNPGPGR